MKVLHTSDWHLGQNFMGKSREDEHSLFFNWLVDTIKKEDIDVLIVAGDIFDTGTPPNYALEMYYNLLGKLSSIGRIYIIITAGNHDSVSTLKAPKKLLESFNTYVITSGNEDENELIEIHKDDDLVGVICAVPFLRDSVVRKAMSGQSSKDKEFSLNEGIKKHYNDLQKCATKLTLGKDIPIIATGHLTTVGSKLSDSERDIYIGGSLEIESNFFGSSFDYVALGHLHINQKVSSENVRYSGSPIALSFSEASSVKRVNIITFDGKKSSIRVVDIPLFRELLVIKGDFETVVKILKDIDNSDAWIEVHLDDKNPTIANRKIRDLAISLGLTILAIKVQRDEYALHSKEVKVQSLDELTPLDVFNSRVDIENIEDDDFKQRLIQSFQQVVSEVEKR
jgi:exonuclease SbcD